ncbi:protein serine threonine phosphatase 2c [Phaffia rhodozyma]|uniref:Protein serine threonine phosphatase 2c n=1 Tax=Phaffia rhodozyma TaxID=264483 RepID=A0A0F7SV48_PHARH|nr:protein serine threonine phosphatase 2c [Phaffia rhodozyma]
MPLSSVSASCPTCVSIQARRTLLRQTSFSEILLGQPAKRSVSDYVRGVSPAGNKIKYSLPKLVGSYQSRGTRPYQEDALLASAVQIKPEELKYSLRLDGGTGKSRKQPGSSLGEGVEFWGQDTGEGARGWEPTSPTASELALLGIFDGHGGKDVSAWLSEHMADYVESTKGDDVNGVVEYMQSLGGYFRRFNGGLLSSRYSLAGKASPSPPLMTLAERLTLAYLRADRRILTTLSSANQGSTGSCALLHSLDNPSSPFFQAKRLNITIAHVGDTKILLTRKSDGLCRALTEKHHADARVEDGRLRKMGKNVGSVADAFGESRFMGVLENTRAFGDGRWKSTGVTSEPQITSRTINGQDYSYLILISSVPTLSGFANRHVDILEY